MKKFFAAFAAASALAGAAFLAVGDWPHATTTSAETTQSVAVGDWPHRALKVGDWPHATINVGDWPHSTTTAKVGDWPH
ncbi:hypothetical protein ACQ3I4_05110 [Zafaria sp. Z1313]|uniref:hypothetical protein n=1 Tax=unclassified Zafaria TaxID=2828765 RepID=UPI002E770E5B|nr:hypothetical protein [Zafaria sp. J156]MEE1621370.1 hypothetical protein [Zafaria sp. J156]